MDIEELARRMRERAIDETTPEERRQQDAKAIQRRQLENLRKLYFNAGRYAGGARDKKAKQAFERIASATH